MKLRGLVAHGIVGLPNDTHITNLPPSHNSRIGYFFGISLAIGLLPFFPAILPYLEMVMTPFIYLMSLAWTCITFPLKLGFNFLFFSSESQAENYSNNTTITTKLTNTAEINDSLLGSAASFFVYPFTLLWSCITIPFQKLFSSSLTEHNNITDIQINDSLIKSEGDLIAPSSESLKKKKEQHSLQQVQRDSNTKALADFSISTEDLIKNAQYASYISLLQRIEIESNDSHIVDKAMFCTALFDCLKENDLLHCKQTINTSQPIFDEEIYP